MYNVESVNIVRAKSEVKKLKSIIAEIVLHEKKNRVKARRKSYKPIRVHPDQISLFERIEDEKTA